MVYSWGFTLLAGIHVNLVLGSDEGTRSVLNMEERSNKRRPFFTTADDLLEEEYYDEQLPEKKRRLTPEQVSTYLSLPSEKIPRS